MYTKLKRFIVTNLILLLSGATSFVIASNRDAQKDLNLRSNQITSTTITNDENVLIKGVVQNEKGEPLIGASVLEINSQNGAVTDIDGKFKLKISSLNAKIAVSFITYKTKELQAQKEMVIILEEDTEALEEVIVVGYTKQKKESLTGSMSNIKADKLKGTTTPSVENLLNSKVPGVYVAPGSGQPGSGGAVVIRGQATLNGSTAPLWVIDGIIIGSNPGQLNPNDIQSMTILKDAASTAIYGSQGANGVIVVTTKDAKKGEIIVNADAKLGISKLNNGNLKVMNGAELYDYFASFENADQISFPRWNKDLRNDNFDWWNLATQTGLAQDYNVSVRGGTNKLQSYFSLGYYDEEGAVKGYDYKRYNFLMKTTYKPYKWLSIRPSLRGSMRDIDDKQYSVTAMYSQLPWDNPYDENGKPVPNKCPNWVNSAGSNYLYDLQWNHSESKHYEIYGSLDFDIIITDWLTFASVNNYNYNNYASHGYADPRSNAGLNTDGRITEYRHESVKRYTNHKLLIDKSWGDHFLNGLIAYEFNDYWGKSLDVNGTGFIPGFEILDVVAKPEKTKGGISEWAVQSYFTQWKYNYASKYLAELSLRRDGASNFGDNAKYGNFFSLSGGWIISKENWFKVNWIDNLKLRAAFGSVGNKPNSLYPQYDLYSVSSTYNQEAGALISQVGNKDLTWEKTYTTGIGIDLNAFNNRVRFSTDLYIKDTDNILYNVPVTGLTGVTRIYSNIGKMKNKGFEIQLGVDIIRSKTLNWTADFNIGHNSNELRDLYKQLNADGTYSVKPVITGGDTNIAGAEKHILEIGEPIDTYYLPKWAGVNKENGKPMWYTEDKDGKTITTSEYAKAKSYKCGNSSPTVFGGFSTNLTWKNFDLNAVFGYSIGGKIYNYSRQEYDSDGTYTDRNQMKLHHGWSRWQKPGDIATHPRALYNNQDKGNKASSRFIEDSDFLKLRTLTLGYTFNLRKYGIRNLRLYLSGENLFTITDYSGVDPEIPAINGSVIGTASPSVYPSVRRYAFGLNLTF